MKKFNSNIFPITIIFILIVICFSIILSSIESKNKENENKEISEVIDKSVELDIKKEQVRLNWKLNNIENKQIKIIQRIEILEKNQQYLFRQLVKIEDPDIQFDNKLDLKNFGE